MAKIKSIITTLVLSSVIVACGQSSPVKYADAAIAPVPECPVPTPYPAPGNLVFPDYRTGTGPVIPATFQFFGPTQTEGALTISMGPEWTHPDAALTPSTKLFRFDLPHPNIASARWTVAWIPRSPGAAVRLVAMDIASPSPVNPVELAVICSSNRDQPTAVSLDVTQKINDLAKDGRTRIIVQQFRDDGVAWTLYESRLELNFEL